MQALNEFFQFVLDGLQEYPDDTTLTIQIGVFSCQIPLRELREQVSVNATVVALNRRRD